MLLKIEFQNMATVSHHLLPFVIITWFDVVVSALLTRWHAVVEVWGLVMYSEKYQARSHAEATEATASIDICYYRI